MKKEENMEHNFFSKWAKFFIDKYKITILLLITLIGLGIFGMTANQRQDFPSMTVNYIFIQAIYPGADAETIAKEVLSPIEKEIETNDQVQKMRSTARANSSFTSVEVKSYNKDEIKSISSELKDSVNSLNLPQDVDVNVFTQDVAGPSLGYVLTSSDKSLTELIELAPEIKTYLEKSSTEIKEVQIMPDSAFTVKIELDSEKLLKNALTSQSVKTAIESNLNILPAGSVVQDNITKQISINKTINSIEDIESIVVGKDLKLKDVAEIKRENIKLEESLIMAAYVNSDGQPQYKDEAVNLLISKKDEADVISMKEDVEAALEEIYEKNIIPKTVELNLTYDTSVIVEDSINSLVSNGLIGLLAILVIFLFFIDIRTGIVVSLIIPFAFLITFFILYKIGYSLNILTLFALILTLGILVDNAIVIAEGILHRIRYEGKTKVNACLEAIRDLGPAITAATATTVVVFIPFTQLDGFMGEILKYIPITIIIMLLVSFFLAISITPLLSRFILKQETQEERKKRKLKLWQKILIIPAVVYFGQKIIDGLVIGYDKIMTYVHDRRWLKSLIIIVLILSFISSISLVVQDKISATQFPVTDSPQFSISVEYPNGTDQASKKELMSGLMQEVINVPYFKGSLLWENQVFVIIADPDERNDDPDTTVYTIVDDLDKKVQYIRDKAPEGSRINIGAQSYGPPEASYDLIVEVKNSDAKAIENGIKAIDEFVKNSDYDIKRINNELSDSLIPSIEINFNEDKIEEYGITPMTTSAIINSVFSKSDIGKITLREDGVQDDIILSYNEESTNSVDDLEDILVPTAIGLPVKLSEVAEIKAVEKTESINYIDGERSVTYQVALDAEEQERSKISEELQLKLEEHLNEDRLESLDLNKDSIAYGGFAAEIQSDFENLVIVFVIAMIAVYVILIFQFGSYSQPTLIMVAVPVALIGVFPGLYLVKSSIDMISGLGIVALVGIVVNDAIVFVDYYNRLRKLNPDWNIKKILIKTGKTRFKPILSTSLTTIAGILPLTLTDVFWRGLGTALVSGLIFATLGNLIVLPILISFVDCFPGKCKKMVAKFKK